MSREHGTASAARLSFRILALSAVIGSLLLAFSSRHPDPPEATTDVPDPVRAQPDRVYVAGERVHDELGLLGSHVPRYHEYLRAIETETGIDIRLRFTRLGAGEPVEQFAVEEATRLGIGREGGRLRGLLVVYDATSERIRVEVGYGLEEYFTDAFVGYLIEQHAESFFRAGNPELGIRLLIRILHGRIRDHMMGGRFDPTPFMRRDSARYVFGGAGATGPAVLGNDAEAVRSGLGRFREPFDPVQKRHFGAQPTPDAAYRKYLEWLERRRFDPDVELFTPASRVYLAQSPITPAYSDYILSSYYGHTYRIVERGDLAVLHFISTPFTAPIFLRKGDGGWRVDTIEEVANSRRTSVGY